MTFFNKDEDVMTIELTPHGRKLLSHGKLKPFYYAFYDDDILYDSDRAGFSETNSETKNRILVDTPSLKPDRTNIGVEANLFKDGYLDDSRILLNEIGTNSHIELKSPAWQINFLQGEISSSTDHLSSSNNSILLIPQIECEINYTLSLEREINKIKPNLDFVETTDTKADGRYIQIIKDEILMDVLEKNGFDYRDSFEIEVYTYEYDGKQNRCSPCENSLTEFTLRKLHFLKQEVEIQNDLLLDPEERDPINPTTQNVEYYLNLSVDREIPREQVCKSLNQLEARNIFLDIDYDCSSFKEETLYNKDSSPYVTSITPQDIEDCEK